MSADIWSQGYTIHITSFWDWSPESWGTVGYTRPGRRESVIRETTDPFIVIVYVTKQANDIGPDMRGKITGFYLVSHVKGHRDKFTTPDAHARYPKKWQYSLKALRAFSFLPEYRMDIDYFDPTIKNRALSVARDGEEASRAGVGRLKEIPFFEVPVYSGRGIVEDTIHVPKPATGKARPGPPNYSGYFVPGEPVDTEKELYALVLHGDTGAFLGEPAAGRRIYKLGLSMSPKSRLETFRRAMPQGAFNWELHRSTRKDNDSPYLGFEAALAGEDAMKDELGSGGWRGGEFYAVTEDQFSRAWEAGRTAARSFQA